MSGYSLNLNTQFLKENNLLLIKLFDVDKML